VAIRASLHICDNVKLSDEKLISASRANETLGTLPDCRERIVIGLFTDETGWTRLLDKEADVGAVHPRGASDAL